MTWREAYSYMKFEGGKVTRKSWLKDDYLYIEKGLLMCDGGYEYLAYLTSTIGKWLKCPERI